MDLEEEITENRTDERHDTEYPVPEIEHPTAPSERKKKKHINACAVGN